MRIVIGVIITAVIFGLWCCLKVGSDADDEMGCL